ncbi:MAG TPA: VTT domain-containing protein [Rariglobus sp.]|nr:VTT domain-containing protein [Rariglobus sp.]
MRIILCAAVLVIGLGLVAWKMDLGAEITRCIGFLREAGPAPFFTAMAVLPVFGFPLSPFTFAAGPVFGPTMGAGAVVMCAILATVVNVALSYWVAARALRPLMERLMKWLGYELPRMPEGTAWEASLLVRIVPGTPFFLQSYLLGLAGVPFGIYMVVSSLVPAAYIVGTILAGDALMRRDPGALAAAGAVFVLAGAGLHRLRKKLQAARRARASAEQGGV